MDYFLPTKGIEYLMVLGYLALFIPFWWVLSKIRQAPVSAGGLPIPQPVPVRSWFAVPEDLHFHRGHTWVAPEGPDVVRVGFDDFAQQMFGQLDGLRLPDPGSRLEQGETGWSVSVGDHEFDVLSPVPGEVLEVNEGAERSPDLVSSDPYGRGWLMKIRMNRPAAALRNLLSPEVARAWMDDVSAQLSARMGEEVGVALQDGGVPVSGFGRHLGGADWTEVAAGFILSPEVRRRTEVAGAGDEPR